jgi:hypothetical protein
MKRPARKPREYVRCPVCGTEFWRNADRRWCSTVCVQEAKRGARGAPRRRQVVLTPGGRFLSVAGAARHLNVTSDIVLQRIREGCPGWQFEMPYQVPAEVVPSGSPRRKHEDRP